MIALAALLFVLLLIELYDRSKTVELSELRTRAESFKLRPNPETSWMLLFLLVVLFVLIPTILYLML